MANQTTVTNILPIGVEKILVQSNDKSRSVDLNSGGFVSLEYSESILHDTIKASVQFVDTGDTQGIDNKNVLEGLPLVGRLETKVVEKRASGELTNEPWTERPFQVHTSYQYCSNYDSLDSVNQ